MSWLEIIELRSSEAKQPYLEELLRKMVLVVDNQNRNAHIRAYTRINVVTDTSIHIKHNSTPMDINGSLIGIRLASTLKEHGFVSHRIWAQLKQKPTGKKGKNETRRKDATEY